MAKRNVSVFVRVVPPLKITPNSTPKMFVLTWNGLGLVGHGFNETARATRNQTYRTNRTWPRRGSDTKSNKRRSAVNTVVGFSMRETICDERRSSKDVQTTRSNVESGQPIATDGWPDVIARHRNRHKAADLDVV